MSEHLDVIEAKYISIKWADQKSAISIKESKDALSVIKIDSLSFEIEASAFSKVDIHEHGQIAFRVIDKSVTESLHFVKNNGEKRKLLPVIDNATKNIWWVEGETWTDGDKKQKKEKRWQSEAFRSAGNINLNVGKYSCLIKIGSCSFSHKELSNYLQDFKNDLWYLILHETSYISAKLKEKKDKVLDEDSVHYFNQFNEFADKVAKTPKSELREVQELKDIKIVRPIPRTFMEIATTGYRKQLTSRSSQPTYNVPENQYVLFTINRVIIILNNLNKVTDFIATSLSNSKSSQKTRITNFSDKVVINRSAVLADYSELRNKVIEEKFNITQFFKEQNTNNIDPEWKSFIRTITLGKKLDYISDRVEFFLKSGLIKIEKGYYILSFNSGCEKILTQYSTYKIKAYITYSEGEKNEKNVINIKFEHLESVEQIDSLEKLLQLDKKAYYLRENDWKRPLTSSEIEDQRQEIIEIKASIVKITKGMSQNEKVISKMLPVLKKLKKTQKKFRSLKVQPSSLFPNSMSFIQNPNYQGVHKLYKEILELSGIDENLFKGLEEADDIGILNISLIYERWCLLQIIKILISKLKFLPEQNWKHKLINQIVTVDPNKVRNASIEFENSNTCQKVTLWYEKELQLDEGKSSPRRADFVIDYKSNLNNITENRLVLDAKFYESINEMGGICGVINEMYNTKNYSNFCKNQVFILHPSRHSVPELKTPQEWANDNFLGETKQFSWDSEFPNHRYGAIFLSPIENKGHYLDSLQMTIGMFLQYGIGEGLPEVKYNDWVISQKHISKAEGINPLPTKNQFCLICGSHECTYQVKKTYYGLKWELTCNECHHKTLYNYCINQSCRHRLIKHGTYWTYHATQSLQPYNIKCPSCGEIAVDMESE